MAEAASESDDGRNLTNSVRLASEELNADIWLYSGPINDYGLGEVIKNFPEQRQRPNALLILVTNGGSANAAYQIASLFQSVYEEFSLFIPSYCKSAGTLIACGANRVFMDVFSELGPLDVQLMKPNEIAVNKSGLLSGSTFDALTEASYDMFSTLMLRITVASRGQISFSLAAELSSMMTTALMSGIYSQIDPDVIGSDYRDLSVAYHYGIRLAEKGGNCNPFTIHALVNHYPSHDFIIDIEEANDLFAIVQEPSDVLYVLVAALGDPAYNEVSRPLVMNFTEIKRGEEKQERQNEMASGEKADRPSDPASGAGSKSRRAGSKPAARKKK